MKKFLLAAFVALVLSFSASAETVQLTVRLTADGLVTIENSGGDTKIEVSFDDEVFTLGDAWREAIRTPGTIVPVTSHVKAERSGLFHIKKTTIIDTGVIYDGTGSVTVVRDVVGTSEMEFTLFLVLITISLVSAVLSDPLFRKGARSPHEYVYWVILFSAFFATISSIPLIHVSAKPFSFTLLGYVALIVFAVTNPKHRGFIFLYYVFLTIAAGTFIQA